MKKLLVVTIAMMLVAGSAFAAASGPLSSIDKIPASKPGATEPNKGTLDCSGAIEVALNNSYTGSNVGAPNNVSTYGCSTWSETGGEVVYHLYLATPTMFEGSITTSGCDLDLAVLDQCDETLGCLIVVDSGVITNVPVSGDFYFVVDGYAGAECSFTFTINETIPPEPVDFCADVLDVTGTHFESSTCAGANNVSSLDCGDYTENGLEEYYEIVMPAGSSFSVDVTNTADGALWLLDTCAEPFTCLAYADNSFTGETETLAYTNSGATTMTVYLVVDSWGTDSCGDYVMDFYAVGGAVPTEAKSFSDVKAMFR